VPPTEPRRLSARSCSAWMPGAGERADELHVVLAAEVPGRPAQPAGQARGAAKGRFQRK